MNFGTYRLAVLYNLSSIHDHEGSLRQCVVIPRMDNSDTQILQSGDKPMNPHWPGSQRKGLPVGMILMIQFMGLQRVKYMAEINRPFLHPSRNELILLLRSMSQFLVPRMLTFYSTSRTNYYSSTY